MSLEETKDFCTKVNIIKLHLDKLIISLDRTMHRSSVTNRSDHRFQNIGNHSLKAFILFE